LLAPAPFYQWKQSAAPRHSTSATEFQTGFLAGKNIPSENPDQEYCFSLMVLAG
jgi:hypothetical protein